MAACAASVSPSTLKSMGTGAVDRFNKANPNGQIAATTFQNDAYKTKIKTAIGAGQAPTIIWGWGGGSLRSYVAAGQVDDLTSWFDQARLLGSQFQQGPERPGRRSLHPGLDEAAEQQEGHDQRSRVVVEVAPEGAGPLRVAGPAA